MKYVKNNWKDYDVVHPRDLNEIANAVNDMVDGKQNKLEAGDGIEIDGDKISAKMPEYAVTHKKLVVDDVSEFLYDMRPKTLASYEFTMDDVDRFLNDSLTVEVVVHPMLVFLKLIFPGLYKVYDTFIPSAMKKILGNCHKLKFDTQKSEVYPVQKMSDVVQLPEIVEYMQEHSEEIPGVEAGEDAQLVWRAIGAFGGEYELYISIGSYVCSILFLEYFGFEPMKFWIINDFKLHDQEIKSLVAVTDNKLGLPSFTNGKLSTIGRNDFSHVLFREILKNVPKDHNYDKNSAMMAMLKYLNDSFADEMQGYYESQGFRDYDSFKNIFRQLLGYIGNPESMDGVFIGAHMFQSFLDIMKEGEPSNEELEAARTDGYDTGYNDVEYDSSSNPYTSPSMLFDAWQEGYDHGYEDGHSENVE